jgi:2-polyprenyl-6-methoxyphenol hydroxylase-like FAD-dependent oxidoreductase
MGAASNVLIVGAGPAGLSSAIALRRAGVDVELVERSPTRDVPGSELMVGGSFLRALDALQVAERCVEVGIGLDTTRLCAAGGQVMTEVAMPSVARAELPRAAGITRNNLLGILLETAEAMGSVVRHGTTIEGIDNGAREIGVAFSDGRSGSYDLVVGADGVRSTVRHLTMPDAPQPRYTGQGVWRARVPRTGDPMLAVFFGSRNKAGFITVSDESQYVFCVVNAPNPERLPEERFPELLREVLAEYGGAIGEVREQIRDRGQVYYSGLVSLILPVPWHRGRVLLIGDAAHACTPHLAYGAGIAVEDGVVLGEVLSTYDRLPAALEAFMRRRYERCRMVVDNSLQLGEWEQNAVPETSRLSAELTEQSWAALAEPI